MLDLLHVKLPTTTVPDVVTLGASLVAAVAAISGTIVAAVGSAKAHEWVGRDQWWTRFSWALEKSVSKDSQESELGLAVLIGLVDVPWAKREDNEMAIAAAGVVSHQDGE